MANIQSQIKRNRQNEKRRLRNRDARGSARTAVKLAFTSLDAGQENAAQIAAAIRALDIAARKGAIHQRNAARRKSRLLKRLGSLRSQGKLVPAQEVVAQPARPRKAEKAPAPAPVAEPKAEARKAPAKAAAKKAPAKKTAKK